MFGNRFVFTSHSHMVAVLACGMTISISAGTAPARAAEVTVTDAKVAAGKLAVTSKKSVNPPGTWISTIQYSTNDVVVSGGSSWRAKASNIGKPPAANLAYWEQFTAKGATGVRRPAGAKGTAGVKGDNSDTGPAGSIILNCSEGQVAKWVSGALACASRSTLPCCSVYE